MMPEIPRHHSRNGTVAVPRSPSDDGREVSMGEGTQVVANPRHKLFWRGANDVPSQQSPYKRVDCRLSLSRKRRGRWESIA